MQYLPDVAASATPVADGVLPVGTVIDGEYRIDGLLGQGGMGVVHRGYDLKLERPVAVKVHRGQGVALERLVREATALARLAHPNVVAVHRVGTHHGRVYVAMELVEGGTARDFVATPRPWRELVRLYAAAGDGLAAAHAAGLIHRDFKPDNVLVGSDGRPRVADFGLARAAGEVSGPGGAPVSLGDATTEQATQPTAETHADRRPAARGYLAPPSAPASGPTPRLHDDLTATGSWVGTPAYMAPEQLDGGVVDARTDQFAFAVSLWEALRGTRPFRGESTAELRDAIARGEPATGSRPGVPRWIDDVLRRALREDPAARWPDLPALLAALRADPGARRRRLALGAAALALAAGAAAIAWQVRGASERGPRCGTGAAEIAGVWGPTEAARLRAAFIATGHPAAAAIGDRVVAALDDYAAAWATRRDETCRGGARAWSPPLAERAAACLARRRDALAEAAGVLAAIDAAHVDTALTVTDRLPAVADCARAAWLDGAPVPPADPAAAAAYDDAQRAIARAQALQDLRSVEEAKPVAELAVAAARRAGDPRVVAEALIQRARVALYENDPAAAAMLEDAFFTARGARASDVGASAANLRVLAAIDAVRFDDATTWLRHAEAEIAAAELGSSERAQLAITRAIALEREGKLAEAIAALEDAHREADPARLPRGAYAELLELEASLRGAAGDHARALALGDQALTALETWLGQGHAALSGPLSNHSLTLSDAGRHPEAIAVARRAVDVCRPSPSCRPSLPVRLLNLGSTMVNGGDDAAALPVLDEAEGLLPPGRPGDADRALIASTRGLAFDHLDRLADSEAAYRDALEVSERATGPDHLDVAWILNNLGNVLNAQQKFADAVPVLERAVAIWERVLPGGSEAARPLIALGRAQLGVGRPRLAVTTLRDALARADAAGMSAALRATARLRLSQAQWATGARADARTTAAEAAATRDLDAALRDELAAWQRTMDPR